MTETIDFNTVRSHLLGNNCALTYQFRLQVGECLLAVKSNSEALIDQLAYYFRHIVVTATDIQPVIDISLIQQKQSDFALTFKDWKRETGKLGRKDSYHDFDGARLIHKVRTGMMFLQSTTDRIASGDCLKNDNQVINFIIAQYMNELQQKDWLIGHAAAIEKAGKAIALAAFSGGGKSTSMLRLLDLPECNFLTNDRLFMMKSEDSTSVKVSGVPKLPRVNPGTLLTNPRLLSILPESRQSSLLDMSSDELWALEEKYDVDIIETYGADRINHVAELGALLILNWCRDGEAMTVQPVDITRRRDLLPALMKSPGPFYQRSDGRFYTDDTPLKEEAYLQVIAPSAVYEVSGGVDFDALVHWCEQTLE